MSDYNAGPHYRGPHSLPLRLLLRVQVNDYKQDAHDRTFIGNNPG